MFNARLKKAKYTDEAYDFVTDLVRLKNIVIRAQKIEIDSLKEEVANLRNLLAGRI